MKLCSSATSILIAMSVDFSNHGKDGENTVDFTYLLFAFRIDFTNPVKIAILHFPTDTAV